MYYRLSNDIKNVFIKFFKKIFHLVEKGNLQLTDGRLEIKFEKIPKCRDLDTYEEKALPVVLVGLGPSSFTDSSITKYRGTDTENGAHIYGGSVSLNIVFEIIAGNEEDRNNLADFVCIYLSRFDTKQQFENKFGLRLKMPTVTADQVVDEPQKDVKRFSTTINISVDADFEESTSYVDSLGNEGLTVEDVISLISDVDEDGEQDDSSYD